MSSQAAASPWLEQEKSPESPKPSRRKLSGQAGSAQAASRSRSPAAAARRVCVRGRVCCGQLRAEQRDMVRSRGLERACRQARPRLSRSATAQWAEEKPSAPRSSCTMTAQQSSSSAQPCALSATMALHLLGETADSAFL